MQAEVFQRFAELAQRLAGISLRPGSGPLVTARVAPRLRALELPDERAYVSLLEASGAQSAEAVHFLDAISTGFTSFWREGEHFADAAMRVQQGWARGQRRFRFWSAACSSGEEPYSLAMALADALQDSPADWRVLATDLSVQRLEHALVGRYLEAEVAPLEPKLRAAYLSAVREGPGAPPSYEVTAEIKERVKFRRLNLAEAPYPMHGPLDAIFCRNVMFYFDEPACQRLVSEAERLLKPGGVLYIGSAETLNRCETSLTLVRPSVFMKPGGPK